MGLPIMLRRIHYPAPEVIPLRAVCTNKNPPRACQTHVLLLESEKDQPLLQAVLLRQVTVRFGSVTGSKVVEASLRNGSKIHCGASTKNDSEVLSCGKKRQKYRKGKHSASLNTLATAIQSPKPPTFSSLLPNPQCKNLGKLFHVMLCIGRWGL